jgi:electron transfer flavoprotein alpha/beta subunit
LSAAFGTAEVVAVVAGGAAVATAPLRAIGRGFGSGTLLAAAAGTHNVANARHVAKAVDRNAAARTDRVTAFPDGESFDLTSPRSI